MTVREKLLLRNKGLIENGPITIVAFGDSITHGAFEVDVIDYDSVYHRLLAKMLTDIRSYVPVNVINSGICGATAKQSLSRMERDIFKYEPDLVIVCFGLNDVNGTLEDYLGSMKVIFENCLSRNIETVFLTPNMMNTYVPEDTPKEFIKYATKTAQYQQSGRVDTFIESAAALARKMGVKVADCYSIWKELSKTEDTTALLSNRINHPKRELHKMFAEAILNEIIDLGETVKLVEENTVYRGI